MLVITLTLLLLAATPVLAEQWHSVEDIRARVEAHVKGDLAGRRGEHVVHVSRIDERLRLPRCTQLTVYLPAGNRLWGNTSIQVRCSAPSPWAIHVPVQVRVNDDVLVTLRPLAAGQAVRAEDVRLERRDITLFAGSALTSTDQLAGKTLAAAVAAGQPLRLEMLRAAKIIRVGQSVRLVASGRGFRITANATALGHASLGEMVTVRTRSGQIVKGKAVAEGVVEVVY